MDYYRLILDVPDVVSKDEIKQAYRSLVMKSPQLIKIKISLQRKNTIIIDIEI
ncbi:hypothetical protein [Enterococcus mundtii]|uniref:hypothetical protein n=1 Tax=Enterococcus mundtii TaxID=53346 RepID=UPI00129C506C|nr:hypothetical protein [Enterococcus mundtii]